jgi:hypothetical protein
MRATATAAGSCIKIEHNRDPDGDGVGPAWAGWFWLEPNNDPNDGWGNGPTFDLGGTASTVTFYAWGAAGNEVVNLKAGIGDDPGGEVNTGDITLTTTPTEYTLDVSGRNWTEVLGAFGFAVLNGPTNNTPQTFYVDDITWQ